MRRRAIVSFLRPSSHGLTVSHLLILFAIAGNHEATSLTLLLLGIARKQATWLLAGKSAPRARAAALLSSGGNVVDLGDDVGAANIVKLCGNFLIAVCSPSPCLSPLQRQIPSHPFSLADEHRVHLGGSGSSREAWRRSSSGHRHSLVLYLRLPYIQGT